MREGVLFYDSKAERYDIRFKDRKTYGGLHCGDTFDVFEYGSETWIPTRIEYDPDYERWYMVGVRARYLDGLDVRV